MFPYVEDYDGYAVKRLMLENVDVLGYLSLGYLALVWKGPAVVRRLNGETNRVSNSGLLRYAIIVWNLLLSAFSFFGMIVVVPAFLTRISQRGMLRALCGNNDEMFYRSSAGFWIGMFVLSKAPELVDTMFLLLQGKTPPFLHWYHHVTVLIFSWHTYCDHTSTMVLFAAMNLTVHFIMYFYFAMCACGFKKTMRKFAPFITMLQILQMVVGSLVTTYSAYKVYTTPEGAAPGCHVSRANARMGVIMYMSYLYLFSEMFLNSYARPKKPVADPTAAGKKV
ncbi:putative fatty acid elongase [Trypanosoma cruzi]|uniref:Fatty acid elongase 2 n=2 Tax=Trypanosoma cruzi TaxID=5693 RepID=ELO2_TRYCC|nr:fatty acid elongase, putative [Trypanosoma cruzi]EAN92120.1 fatty acid elongase, putative [Trypanosoma cruzi]PWV07463.1 putative fatty acid elongase [Trypanosoma cruzi]|eukprot:XP_813971.1 fatty acid elongase [Trypanosoma cruzi strain CL Brener]